MEMVTKFIANDGTEFDSEGECERHEELASLRDVATKFALEYLRNDDPSATGDPPAQRSVTRVVNVIVAWEEKHWELKTEENKPELVQVTDLGTAAVP